MHLPRLRRPLSPGLLPWRRLPTGSRRLQRSAGSRPASASSAAASDERVSRSCRAGGNVPGAARDRSVSSRVRLPGFSGRRGRQMQPSRPRTVEAGVQVTVSIAAPRGYAPLCRRRSTRRRLPEVLVLEGKLMWKVLQHAVRRSGARPSSPAPSAIDPVRHLLVLLLMLGCAAGLAGSGAAQDTVRVGPYDVPGNIDVVAYPDRTDFHWRPLRLRIDYGDAHGPFDQSRVDVVWEASLHWSCPPGIYGEDARRALLHLPWHPDTEAYTVFNSVRVWWLWLIGRDVVHHEVEAVIGNEPPFAATVERLQASYSFNRPRLMVHLPQRPVSRMLLRDAPLELRLLGDGVDAWYRFGRPEPERLDETSRARLRACARG